MKKIYFRKEMIPMRKNNRKGFTLAELLIVVAIIAVLVAIAIPVFTTQLEKSREATDLANVRSAYAAVVVDYLDDASAASITVSAQQKVANWQNNGGASTYSLTVFNDSGTDTIAVPAVTDGSYTVSISTSGVISVTRG